jgi:hypothetical protein
MATRKAHSVRGRGLVPIRNEVACDWPTVVVASPSGFARLVTETGTPDEGQGMPPAESFDMDRFLRVAAELGDELVDPPGAVPTDAGR